MPVQRGISLAVERGEFVALMGASGCGKTTLMNVLGSLDRPTGGRYWLDGVEVSALDGDGRAALRSGKIGFVFQNFNLLPRMSALRQAAMPLEYAPAARAAAGRVRAEALLRRLGLGDRLTHIPSKMSGGQQQRVAIARALVNDPLLLLADEPTGDLDSHTTAEIPALLEELNADGLTIVMVTHDPEVARRAGRIVRIKDGVVEGDARRAG